MREQGRARYTCDMNSWAQRVDELKRTIFGGQLDIEGGEQSETEVRPKKAAPRSKAEGLGRGASSFAGEDDQLKFEEE